MIESIVHIDQKLFIIIHEAMANPVLDSILLLVRDAKTWIPLYLFYIVIVIKNHARKGLYILAITALLVVLTDQFSAGLMKPFFERLRPCHNPDLSQHIRNIINCGGQYGFISSHATNHFGLAVFFSWFFHSIYGFNFIRWIFYGWAGLICFAQVYVGKHYPSDVLCGAMAGLLIGHIILTLLKRLIQND